VVVLDGPMQGSYDCSVWGEVVHLETANALARFKYDYYADKPAITVNKFGRGNACYLATQLDEDLMHKLTEFVCDEANVRPVLRVPIGVEVTARIQSDGRRIFFLLNHTDEAIQVPLPGDSRFTELLTGRTVWKAVSVRGRDGCILTHMRSSSL